MPINSCCRITGVAASLCFPFTVNQFMTAEFTVIIINLLPIISKQEGVTVKLSATDDHLHWMNIYKLLYSIISGITPFFGCFCFAVEQWSLSDRVKKKKSTFFDTMFEIDFIQCIGVITT